MGNQGLGLFNKDCLHFSVIDGAGCGEAAEGGENRCRPDEESRDLLRPNNHSSWGLFFYFTRLRVGTRAATIQLYKTSILVAFLFPFFWVITPEGPQNCIGKSL